MARTFIRQDTQIRQSGVFNDALAAGISLETGSATIEADLNALRSQINRILRADGTLKWYDDIVTVNGKRRGLRDLNVDLDELEEQKTLYRATQLVDVTVPALQNWVVLEAALNRTPNAVAAAAAGTSGAVVARSVLSGIPFETYELIEVSGPNAIAPRNLLLIRHADTGEVIQSGGRDVFGLLQFESTGVDGAAFNDTTSRVKISFVRQNATFDDLEAVPVADIAGTPINYAYVLRSTLDNLPEDAWLGGNAGFVDTSAGGAVSLDAAVDNQSGAVTQTAKDIVWTIDDTRRFAFQDSTGAFDILAIKPAVGGDEVEFNGALLDFNNQQPADFAAGAQFDTARAPIDIGVNAGVIAAGGSTDLRLVGGGKMYLDDGNQTGSGWLQTNGIALSGSVQEWMDFSTAFGEVSLLKGIVQSRRRAKVYAVVTVATAANLDVGGVGGGSNLDVQLPDMMAGNFLTDYDVMINGESLRPGANAAADHDYYPGTSLANGQLRFEFPVRVGDQICVIPYVR